MHQHHGRLAVTELGPGEPDPVGGIDPELRVREVELVAMAAIADRVALEVPTDGGVASSPATIPTAQMR